MKSAILSLIFAIVISLCFQTASDAREFDLEHHSTRKIASMIKGIDLEPEIKIHLKGKATKFDFMASDPIRHRILAAHKGAGTLEILDARSERLIRSVPVGQAQGVAVDPDGSRYFIGNDGEHSVVIVDAKKLIKIEEIQVNSPVDAIAFDSKNGKIYAAADDGDQLWVIDPSSKSVIGQVKIPGVPEGIEYNPSNDRIYLNIKTKNQVVEISPESNQIQRVVSTLPATDPHGLAIDSKRGLVFVAGTNGKLVAVDFKTGKVFSKASIAKGDDQIVFDSEKGLIFSACHKKISVTRVTDSGLTPIGQVESPKGAHTIALDQISHNIWIVFKDNIHSYFQKYLIR